MRCLGKRLPRWWFLAISFGRRSDSYEVDRERYSVHGSVLCERVVVDDVDKSRGGLVLERQDESQPGRLARGQK